MLLLLPLLSNLKGMSFLELPSYLKSGAACFLNLGGETSGKFLHLEFIQMDISIVSLFS